MEHGKRLACLPVGGAQLRLMRTTGVSQNTPYILYPPFKIGRVLELET